MNAQTSTCRPAAAGDSPQPTVFVVDDDVSFLRSISRLLRASGFQVAIHNSASEFLAMLKPDTSGCVVSDPKMPGMDGMALQEALQDAGNPLPILFLTGHGEIPITVQAMRRGFGMGVSFSLKTTEEREQVQQLIALVSQPPELSSLVEPWTR